jgi:uncharacterized heparinase superfamily protein
MLYWMTIKHLQPSQIFWRLHRVYFANKICLDVFPPISRRQKKFTPQNFFARVQKFFENGTFNFLNESGNLEEIGWNGSDKSLLWRYNQHYFDCLSGFNADSINTEAQNLIDDWVSKNPPYFGVGWQPYPTSLRIVNWIKWVFLGGIISPTSEHSLYIQSRLLAKNFEFHLLGNHLFKNAKALIFAGIFFDGRESNKWLEYGFQILDSQLDEQILDDGGHFERSPMYHAIILEDILDLIAISKGKEFLFPNRVLLRLKAISRRMFEWLSRMSHPDGRISFFNDAAFNIAPTLGEIQQYANRINFTLPNFLFGYEQLEVNHLDSSGYICVSSSKLFAILDVAPIGPDYQPGHAHADTLSFELSIYGHRVFVNGGTSCYGVSKQRLYERSSKAHNTVTINEESSSEVWAGFRVGRRAKVCRADIVQTNEGFIVIGEHDGYRRLSSKNLHSRVWEIRENDILISDKISGDYELARSRFIVHPSLLIKKESEAKWTIKLPSKKHITFSVLKGEASIKKATYASEFGSIQETLCICIDLVDGQSEALVSWT